MPRPRRASPSPTTTESWPPRPARSPRRPADGCARWAGARLRHLRRRDRAHPPERGSTPARLARRPSWSFRRSVYTGGADSSWRRSGRRRGEMETVLVVGHNPTAAELTSALCDGEGITGPRRLGAGLRHEWYRRAAGRCRRLGRSRRRLLRPPPLPRRARLTPAARFCRHCSTPRPPVEHVVSNQRTRTYVLCSGMTHRRTRSSSPAAATSPTASRRPPPAACSAPSGMTDDDFAKPQIGVASSLERDHPVQPVARPARQGGQGRRARGRRLPAGVRHDLGVATASRWATRGCTSRWCRREVIADSVETVMQAERLDGSVLLAGCDKSLPGMLMAAARLDLAVGLPLRRVDPAGHRQAVRRLGEAGHDHRRLRGGRRLRRAA